MMIYEDGTEDFIVKNEGIVSSTIGGFINLAELVDMIQHHLLISGNPNRRHFPTLFYNLQIQDHLIKLDALLQIGRVEVQMMQSCLLQSLLPGDLEQIPFRVHERESLAHAAAQCI